MCQLGPCSHPTQAAAELQEKKKTSSGCCEEEGCCWLPLGGSSKLAAASKLGEDEGEAGCAASALRSPPSLGAQEGSDGKECCVGTSGCPGSCAPEPFKMLSSTDIIAYVYGSVLPSSQQVISLGHYLHGLAC